MGVEVSNRVLELRMMRDLVRELDRECPSRGLSPGFMALGEVKPGPQSSYAILGARAGPGCSWLGAFEPGRDITTREVIQYCESYGMCGNPALELTGQT